MGKNSERYVGKQEGELLGPFTDPESGLRYYKAPNGNIVVAESIEEPEEPRAMSVMPSRGELTAPEEDVHVTFSFSGRGGPAVDRLARLLGGQPNYDFDMYQQAPYPALPYTADEQQQQPPRAFMEVNDTPAEEPDEIPKNWTLGDELGVPPELFTDVPVVPAPTVEMPEPANKKRPSENVIIPQLEEEKKLKRRGTIYGSIGATILAVSAVYGVHGYLTGEDRGAEAGRNCVEQNDPSINCGTGELIADVINPVREIGAKTEKK